MFKWSEFKVYYAIEVIKNINYIIIIIIIINFLRSEAMPKKGLVCLKLKKTKLGQKLLAALYSLYRTSLCVQLHLRINMNLIKHINFLSLQITYIHNQSFFFNLSLPI